MNVIELSGLAVEIAQAIVSGFPGERLQAAIELLAGADAVIASTPVYKAGISGLFKSFADVLDNDLLIGKPVILAATAGTPRHAMVVDEQLRPLFAFLRAMPMPTSLFAAPDDWGSSTLGDRIARAATELTLFLRSGVGASIADGAWSGYQHQFGGNATNAERSVADVDFSTDLMRLAAGRNPLTRHPTADSGAGPAVIGTWARVARLGDPCDTLRRRVTRAALLEPHLSRPQTSECARYRGGDAGIVTSR